MGPQSGEKIRNGTVLTNFCVPRGPRFGGAAGRGPPRHAKIDFFLCPHGPLRKYFRSVFSACTDLYENIFEALFPASEWLWQGRRSSSKLRMSAAPTRRSSSTLANSMKCLRPRRHRCELRHVPRPEHVCCSQNTCVFAKAYVLRPMHT